MEQISSEPKQPVFYLVATPKRVELWEASKRPRVTVSKALTRARVPGYSPRGRRVKRLEPIELVRMDIIGDGKRVLSTPMQDVGSMFAYYGGLPIKLRDKFNWVRWGRQIGYQGKGERILCSKLTRQQAERVCEYLHPRGQ